MIGLGREGLDISLRGAWAKISRGALPGAGSWAHQYAEPGNTACTQDQLVKGPMGILWFGRPDPKDMIDVELAPAASQPSEEQLPVLSFLEVTRTSK